MLLTMLETRRGTEDGYTIRLYVRGETYNLGDTLAHAFLSAGFAIPTLPEETEPMNGNGKKKVAEKKRKTVSKSKPKVVVKKPRKTKSKPTEISYELPNPID